MDHLFNSAFRVEEMVTTRAEGELPDTDWAPVTSEDPNTQAMLSFLKGRLDLQFIRPGKDVPQAVNAGSVPDRVGLLLTYAHAPIKAGYRIVAIPNEYGEMPIEGIFELKVIPEAAIGYSRAHHIEVQVVEQTQELLLEGRWPEDDDEED